MAESSIITKILAALVIIIVMGVLIYMIPLILKAFESLSGDQSGTIIWAIVGVLVVGISGLVFVFTHKN